MSRLDGSNIARRIGQMACALLVALCALAHADQLITVKETGPRDKRVNLLFLGDGYTAGQEARFLDDVKRFVPAVLDGPYLENYPNYFNIYAQFNASAQEGATDEVVGVPKNTFFECRYTIPNRHIMSCNFARVGEQQRQVLPDADSVFLIVNAESYGGVASGASVVSRGHPQIASHEFAHSFVKLADEYPSQTELYERANRSRFGTFKSSIKWAQWIADSTPLPTTSESDKVGAYPTQWNGATGYRPMYFSRMWGTSMNLLWGPVNTEQLVLKMYERVSPVDDFTPHDAAPVNWVGAGQLGVTPKTSTRGLKIEWLIDGRKTAETGTTFNGSELRAGRSTVTANVFDDTPLVRLDTAGLLHDSHTWQVDNHLLGALPQARITGLHQVTQGESVTLSAEASGGRGLTYHWSAPGFEPAQSSAVTPSFTAQQPQSGQITLTVTDDSGASSTIEHALVTRIPRQQAATALDGWAARYLGNGPDPAITLQMKTELDELMRSGEYSLPVRRIGIKNLCLVQKQPDNGAALTFTTDCAARTAAQWVLASDGHLRNTLTGQCLNNPGVDLVELTLVPCVAGENRWEPRDGLYLNGAGTEMGLGERGNNRPYTMRGTGTNRQITDGIAVLDEQVLTLARPQSLLLAWRVDQWRGNEAIRSTAVAGPEKALIGAPFTLTANVDSDTPVTYRWSAPTLTPASSTEAMPVFSAGLAGPHDIDLVVTDEEGRTGSARYQVTAAGPDQPPFGRLTGDSRIWNSITAKIVADVHSAQGLPLTYSWHLPPQVRELANPPQPPGTLALVALSVPVNTPTVVGLTVTDSHGRQLELRKDLLVMVAGFKTEITGPARVAPGATFTLSAASSAGEGLRYDWYAPGFTPGNPSTVSPQFRAPMTPGSYTITLYSSNAEEDSARATHTVQVVDEEPGLPTGSLEGEDSVAAGEQVSFTANVRSPGNLPLHFNWQQPPQLVGPPVNGPTVTWTATPVSADTQVTVGVVVTDPNGGRLPLTRTLLIRAPRPGPEARISGPDSVPVGASVTLSAAQSTGDGLTWQWSAPGFTPASASEVSPSFVAPSVPGSKTITLQVTDAQQRVASTGHSITVTGAPGNICAPPWEQRKTYATENEKVSYDFYNYEVAHWTSNQRPDLNWVISGSSKPWRRLDVCGTAGHP